LASVPAATESHYRLLAENSGDVVLWLSEDGRIRWVSPSLTAALGWAPAEWIGRLASDVLGQGGEGLGSGDHLEPLRQGQNVLLRDQARGRDGGLHWVEIHASPFRRADGQREGVVATLRTIDAQVAAERELRLSEERHRLLADNAMDVIWTMAPDGTITYVSPAVESVRGLTAAEAMVQPIEEIHPPASLAVSRGYFVQLFEDLQAGRPLPSFRSELEYFCCDGSTVWMDVIALPLLDDQGQFVELLGVSRDITERKRTALELQRARDAAEAANRALQAANRELARLATTDPLTGLWNRRQLDQRLRQEIERADRYGHSLTLVLFDIDDFKGINDRFGHASGDQVLAELSRRVQGHLRTSDGLGRWGGEEFLVLLPECGGEQASDLAEKLRRLVSAAPFEGVGTVRASFGVAQRNPCEMVDAWFGRVDRALYRAKQRGRDRVELAAAGG
jgi:diguanylate cyclase (GGDEF)-like protein/PAS domain S-box-containing protein